MFQLIDNVLTPPELERLRVIAAQAKFVDGKITAEGSPVKNNVQVGERGAAQQASQIVSAALLRSEDFRVFAFPKVFVPPVLTRYDTGMYYGVHVDSAYMPIGQQSLRSDLSCTVFISDQSDYEGGALRIRLGTADVRIKGKAGSAIVYPSSTLHEVEPITAGQRLIALTFIESRIANAEQREWLFELNEVSAIAGEKMDIETYTRLQRVRENLLRYWSDPD
jgi:PKHD-type hydroxylase